MKKLFYITFLFASSIAMAQDDISFKVLFSKGSNTLENGKVILTGTKILKGQSIRMVEGGYLGMIYKTGKSVELKKAGVYAVNDLEKNVLATAASFSKKYADLVMNEMTKNNEDLTENRKKKMGVTGSVERGIENGLTMFLPKTSDLLSHFVKIKWMKEKEATNGYVVVVKDMFDEPLKNYETLDTFVTVNIADLDLGQHKSFIVTVEPKAVQGKKATTVEGKLVKVLEGKKADDLHKELKSVKDEAGDESALSKIILASFCEQNKLYLEAIDYYEQAIMIEPSVDEYKIAYNNFLERVDLGHIKR